MTIHMKVIEQYFLVVLFIMLYKSVDEKLVHGYPNKVIEQYYSFVQNLRSMNEIHFYYYLPYSKPSDRR